jgi:hypothetical protein
MLAGTIKLSISALIFEIEAFVASSVAIIAKLEIMVAANKIMKPATLLGAKNVFGINSFLVFKFL